MEPPGFGFYWDGVYWASLVTTQPSTGGRLDALFGPVGGHSHHHSWLRIGQDDSVRVGARLKDESTSSRPPGTETTAFSTQTFARFKASRDQDHKRVTTEVADSLSGSAYTAAPVASTRTQSHRDPTPIQVQVPSQARAIEGELAFCYLPRPTPEAILSTGLAFLPLASDSSFGIAIRITKWSTAP